MNIFARINTRNSRTIFKMKTKQTVICLLAAVKILLQDPTDHVDKVTGIVRQISHQFTQLLNTSCDHDRTLNISYTNNQNNRCVIQHVSRYTQVSQGRQPSHFTWSQMC